MKYNIYIRRPNSKLPLYLCSVPADSTQQAIIKTCDDLGYITPPTDVNFLALPISGEK